MSWWDEAADWIWIPFWLVVAPLWLFVVGPYIGSRRFFTAVGACWILASVYKNTRVAGRGISPRIHDKGRPATKTDRIVFFIVGALLIAVGVFVRFSN